MVSFNDMGYIDLTGEERKRQEEEEKKRKKAKKITQSKIKSAQKQTRKFEEIEAIPTTRAREFITIKAKYPSGKKVSGEKVLGVKSFLDSAETSIARAELERRRKKESEAKEKRKEQRKEKEKEEKIIEEVKKKIHKQRTQKVEKWEKRAGKVFESARGVGQEIGEFAGVSQVQDVSFSREQEQLKEMFGGGEKIWGTRNEPVTIHNDLNPSQRGEDGTASIFGFGTFNRRSGLF